MSDRLGDWIMTYTGAKAYPFDFRPEDWNTEDVAHALSNQCRFSGHTCEFYSVAEHSVHVANEIYRRTAEKSLALSGLLHDASEAYLVDIPRPLKRSMAFAAYGSVEAKLMQSVMKAHNLPWPLPEIVKQVDNEILQLEADDLMHGTSQWNKEWLEVVDPKFDSPIQCWRPFVAKLKFLNAYAELTP